ncbi:unnamed protein product [Closterium sp. NIES-65]|nr:unnamed protein product [Closterium sp. NIES-65]
MLRSPLPPYGPLFPPTLPPLIFYPSTSSQRVEEELLSDIFTLTTATPLNPPTIFSTPHSMHAPSPATSGGVSCYQTSSRSSPLAGFKMPSTSAGRRRADLAGGGSRRDMGRAAQRWGGRGELPHSRHVAGDEWRGEAGGTGGGGGGGEGAGKAAVEMVSAGGV